MPPNHVNISALGRVMNRLSKGEKPTREDYDFRKGDETKNSFRLGGITGGMIGGMTGEGAVGGGEVGQGAFVHGSRQRIGVIAGGGQGQIDRVSVPPASAPEILPPGSRASRFTPSSPRTATQVPRTTRGHPSDRTRTN